MTWIQQVGVFISKSLVGQEIISISVQRQEGNHVIAIVVANRGVVAWVAGSRRLVGPEPALIDANEEKK